MRYDGIRAHVKKQHPDVELTRGFSRNLTERSAELVPRSVELFHRSVITQTGESCLCKYYNLGSFLINNGINIEKIKENISLLKSIDNLKLKNIESKKNQNLLKNLDKFKTCLKRGKSLFKRDK